MNNAKDSIKMIANNKDYNDIQKLVRYASIIGGENDWIKADNVLLTQMKEAAQVLIGGSQIDPKERSLFDLVYDSQKDECLFAGEAMQKSEKYIQQRMNRFLSTCNVYIECLKAHKMLANLTPEQIEGMDKETRSIYDRIKSSKASIDTLTEDLIARIMRGSKAEKDMTEEEKKDLKENGKGVFAVAADYYSKDKTVFIDTGNKYVDLKDDLRVITGSTYHICHYNNDVDGKHRNVTNGDEVATAVRKQVDRDFAGGGLSSDDITKIYNHAKKNGMTLKEYLRYCGFNVDNIGNGILVRKSYQGGGWTCYRAGASGYHVGTYNMVVWGRGHDYKSNGLDFLKVFDIGTDRKNGWIYDDRCSDNWFLFFEKDA